MSQQLQMRILRREQIELTDLYNVVSDAKCKRACIAILHVKNSLDRLDSLIDPQIQGVPNSISERTLSVANKKWFTINRSNILSAMSELSLAMEEDIMSLADSPVAVEEACDLNSNLQKLFSAMLKGFEEITRLLSALETTMLTEEILTVSAEIRRTWINIKIMISNQVVIPSTFALREESREDTLTSLALQVEKIAKGEEKTGE